MNESSITTSDSDSMETAGALSLTDVFVTLVRQRKFLTRFTLFGTIVSVALALLIPRYYTATTVMLPPQQHNSAASSTLMQLGALGGIAGITGMNTPDEMYVGLLKSRSVQDGIIQQLKLQERFNEDSLETTRKMLLKRTSISNDKKSGFITLEVDDRDAAFAATLANAYVNELQKLLARLALTDAQQRRMFFEQQVNKTKTALTAAEAKFRQTQAASGLVVTQALAEAGVKESAMLRGQIAALEVQLQTLSRFATQEHPDVQRAGAELSALKRQLSSIEQGSGNSTKTTLHGTQAVQAYRDMKVQEALLETLIKQLELARADEAKEGPLLQQVDAAVPPEKPSKPKRIYVVLAGVLVSMLLALAIAIARSIIHNHGAAIARIRSAWQSN